MVTTKGDFNIKGHNPFMFWLGIFFILCGLISLIGHEWVYCFAGFFLGFSFVKPQKDFRTFEKLDKMTLEDPEFERKYNAYSSDQIEGRYLLTTSFMERFKNLHTAFGSKRAKCSFYSGNKLMIAISTNKNLFEIGNLFSPINNTKRINVFLKEIQSVYDMIDYFKLAQHTGL